MTTFFALLTPLLVLGFCLLFVNGWKLWFQCNYGTRPVFFALIYFFVLGFVFWQLPIHLFPSDFVWIGVSAVAYAVFSWSWTRFFGRFQLPETDTFSVPQQDVAPPNHRSALPKVLEVLLQDVALLSLVILLMRYFPSVVLVTLVCVLVVAVTHVPAPLLFGRFYGRFFLVAGVGWAAVLPYLISVGVVWLGEIFAIHLGMYALMYLWALQHARRM